MYNSAAVQYNCEAMVPQTILIYAMYSDVDVKLKQ